MAEYGTQQDDFRSRDDFRRRRELERRNAAGLAALANRAVHGLPVDGDPPETRTPIPAVGSLMHKALAALDVRRDSGFAARAADAWDRLFPGLGARPSRMDGDMLFLAAGSSAALFMLRPRLPEIRRRLSELPGAPRGLQVKIEVRR